MRLTQHLKIDNSAEYAIKDGNWKNQFSNTYKKLMTKAEWKELLAETFLVAPIENIKNDEDEVTSFRDSRCRYQHHMIYNDMLVISVPGLQTAYRMAKNDGLCDEKMKQHLKRHLQELGELPDFDMTVSSNLEDVCGFIQKRFIDEAVYNETKCSNKEKALMELFERRECVSDYLYAAETKVSYYDKAVDSLLNMLNQRKEMIETDIHSIINGRFDAAMMGKYRVLTPPTYESLVENSAELSPFAIDSQPCNVSLDEAIGEPQYCYRIGFDIDTGRQVAVQFVLEAEQTSKSQHRTMRYSDLPEAKDLIERFGDIDYRTDAFKVNAIFERSGKPLESVKMTGLFSSPIIKAIAGFISEHPQAEDISLNELFETKKFQNYLTVQFHDFDSFNCISDEDDHEQYTVGTVGGYGTYKVTKLLWDRDLLLSYSLTPIFRGYNTPLKESGEEDYEWFSDMLAGLKYSSAKNDLALMEYLVEEDSDWWMAMKILLKQNFVMRFLPGCPEVKNAGHYLPNPPLEKIYFEAMMAANNTVINEYYL